MTYEEAVAYIHSVSWIGHKPGLTRTRSLLAALGDPHKGLKFVHVAGTNGKGSTCAMLNACLMAAGYRVGMFTSPFLNRFNERIQLNGVPIPDADLVRLVEEVRPVAESLPESPTEFEMITGIGMLYFARSGCDIVVLEVGMGGELDSTNVIDTPEAAVITAMGLDHVKELGPTMTDIAEKKAGIIKAGGRVVSYGGNPEADAVFAREAARQGATLQVVDHSGITLHGADLEAITFSFDGFTRVRLPLIGAYQPDNAAVAITALRVLQRRGWRISDEAIRAGLEQVRWPGRFEVLRRRPVVLLDGSHNAHGMRATVESIRYVFPGKKLTLLLAVCSDKDVPQMLQLLAPVADSVVTVEAPTPRALPAGELAALVRKTGVPAEAAPTIEEGVARVLEKAGGEGIVCALGTLYFSGPVRQAVEAQLPRE